MAPIATDTKAKQASPLASTPLASAATNAKHFWLVELHCPPGASQGLRAFIAMADTAIQTAVDLLGRGMTTPPPKVDDLLQPRFYETLGKGEADEQYRKTVDKVEARQLKLLQMDDQVIKTSITVAKEQVSALRSIQAIVGELNDRHLKPAGSAKLKPAQELPLLKAVASAVEAVYDKVTAIADLNEDMANGGGKTNPGGGQAGGGGGAAGGGGGGGDIASSLAQLLPMLAMLPIAAMPLVQQIPEIMQRAEEDKAKKAEENQNKGAPGQPGQTPPGNQNAAAAPPAGDPNAQPAAPQSGDPNAAPAANTAPPGEQSPAPAVAAVPGVIPARRTRDGSPADQTGRVETTQDAAVDDQEGQEASPVIEA